MQSQQEVLCLVIGAKGVGKTSLISKFSNGQAALPWEDSKISKSYWDHLDTHYDITLVEVDINELEASTFSVSQAQVFTFIYDITSQPSYEKAKEVLSQLKKSKSFSSFSRVILIGNKADKIDRTVSFNEGLDLAKEFGSFFEISSQYPIDIDHIYQIIFQIKTYSSINLPDPLPEKSAPLDTLFSAASPPEAQFIQLSSNFDRIINVIILGSLKVGKTSFASRLASQPFPQQYIKTIGVDFKINYIRWNLKDYKLHVWQTSGDEKFEMICASYYRGSQVFFVMYDINDLASFEKVKEYRLKIEKYRGNANYLSIIVIGNKSDLLEQRKVSYQDGENMANEIGAVFFEISCREQHQAKQCFLKGMKHYLSCYPNSV